MIVTVQMLLGVESPNPGWVLAGHVSAVVQHAQPSIQTQTTPGRTQRSCLFLVRLQPTLLHLLLLPFYFCGWCVHCCDHWKGCGRYHHCRLNCRKHGQAVNSTEACFPATCGGSSTQRVARGNGDVQRFSNGFNLAANFLLFLQTHFGIFSGAHFSLHYTSCPHQL